MDHPEFKVKADEKAKYGELVISGYISSYNKNAANQIIESFQALEAKYVNITVILRNCYGGDVYEGIPSFNAIKDSEKTITTQVEGLAASMGAVLFLAGKKRVMTSMSRLMIHQVSGGGYGSAKKLKETATEIEKLNDDLAGQIAEMSGKTKEYVVKNWMKDGEDKYFTGAEAKTAGLATEVAKGKTTKKNEIPQNVLESGDVHEIAMFYNSLNTDNSNENNDLTKNKKMEKLPFFIAALVASGADIKEDATEQEVLASFQASLAENKTLTLANEKLEKDLGEVKTANEAIETAADKVTVENAIASGKLKEGQREFAMNGLKNDRKGTTAFLNSLEGRKSFTNQLRNGGTPPAGGGGDAPKTYGEMMKSDQKGLEKMQKEDPEGFKAFKAAYIETLK
jgi:ATP-dependent Clp protease protease subunit